MRAARWIVPAALALTTACADTKHPAAPPDTMLSLDQSTSPGVHVYQIRTEEDPAVSGAREFCASAPFQGNVFLNATAWATQARSSDGQVVNDGVRRVGTVVACAQLTNFAFPPGLVQNFAARFDFADGGSYSAVGTCSLISNDVPVAKLVLAGCALKVAPNDLTAGGMATSASVFNPFRLEGYQTGSYWTLQLYDRPAIE